MWQLNSVELDPMPNLNVGWRFLTGFLAVLWGGVCAAQEKPNYDRILPDLYLGGHVLKPPPGTRAVLNLCETDDPYKVPVYRWEPIFDVEPAPSIEWLKKQVDFIDAQRKAGMTTYVHCRNGVNRSGFVMVAFVMHDQKMTRDAALKFIRSKRSIVRPNPIFMDRLLEWEKFLKIGC